MTEPRPALLAAGLSARSLPAAFLLAALLPTPVLAQDNGRIALPTTTLAVTRPPEVELRVMDIVITPGEIRGRYVFYNRSDRDIGAIASFPAPDLDGARPGIGYMAIPAPEQLNFMDFSASVDGQAVTLLGEHHVFGAGLERTALLEETGAPLPPASEGAWRALGKLSQQSLHDLWVAGLIDMDRIGERLEPRPRWLLKTTWYWPQVFPAGKETVLAWRHRASVAVTATQAGDRNAPGNAARYARNCATAAAADAAQAALGHGAGNDWLLERAIRQRIVTGPVFAGPAATMSVTIDAGADGAVAASCFGGLERVAPNIWRARRENVTVDEALDVLFLSPGKPVSQAVPPSEEDPGAPSTPDQP